MARCLLAACRQSLAIENRLVFTLSLLCMIAITRYAAAASFSIGQVSFSPSAVAIGGNFSFAFGLSSNAVLSDTIVAMDIFDSEGHVVLEKDVPGQNFEPGQMNPYSWNGTITPGPTLSDRFADGHYKVLIFVWNSNKSSLYMSGSTVSLFTVGWGAAAAPVAGNLAVGPVRPPAGAGRTYYVSDPGNASVDQANRALLPPGATVYPTIQGAADITQPGDTVLVMNGTYETANPNQWTNAVVTINNSGSAAGGYITYASYPGAHPVITSSNTVNTYDVIQNFASYIVLEGFEVVGSARNVTLAQANQTSATEEALLRQEAEAGQPATFPSSAEKDVENGNCIAGQNVTHVIILNNLIHDCSGAGIDFGASDYLTVESNTVYDASWWTMYDTSGISVGSYVNSDSSTAYKIFVLDNVSYDNANTQPTVNNVYKNDVVPGSAPSYPTDGEGIIVDTNERTSDGIGLYLGRTLVAGNITYNNGSSGIEVYKSSHVDTINNTAYMNDTCPVSGAACGPTSISVVGGVSPVSGQYFGQINMNIGSDNNFYNNVLYAPTGKYVFTNWNDTDVVEDDNLMYSANGQILADNYKLSAQDITSDPLFAASASPVTDDFLLSPSSPGINAGISYSNDDLSVPDLLQLNVQDSAVTIGAAQP